MNFIHLPMKMEPIVSSETSATKSQTPGNYPKRNKLHLQHGESLRTKKEFFCLAIIPEINILEGAIFSPDGLLADTSYMNLPLTRQFI